MKKRGNNLKLKLIIKKYLLKKKWIKKEIKNKYSEIQQ